MEWTGAWGGAPLGCQRTWAVLHPYLGKLPRVCLATRVQLPRALKRRRRTFWALTRIIKLRIGVEQGAGLPPTGHCLRWHGGPGMGAALQCPLAALVRRPMSHCARVCVVGHLCACGVGGRGREGGTGACTRPWSGGTPGTLGGRKVHPCMHCGWPPIACPCVTFKRFPRCYTCTRSLAAHW